MRPSSIAAAIAAAVAVGAAFGTAVPDAAARSKTHQDDVRGFRCRVEDSWEQVPPKPGTDDAHIAAVWKDPSPKYRRHSADQPTFKIIWTVKPKGPAKPPEEIELPDWAKELPEEQQEQVRAMLAAGTKEDFEGEVDTLMRRLAYLFGDFRPLKERWEEEKKKKTLKTRSGQEVEVLEVNYHKKRPKDTNATWWLWMAKTEWETETEKIELGFYGYVDVQFAKDFRKQFESAVKTFELREIEEDDADADVPDFVADPNHPEEQKIAKFIKEKVIKGWKTKRTPHYLIVYDEDVDQKRIIRRVAKEIEALREQVYEVMFPPDRPIESISIVRVCETREQYMAYGAPGGSAGYWSPYHEELVLFQDKNDKKDAIRVLYHEAFHQYIYYSVGQISPHSWFNEGHGDFFSGHVYKGGKFKLDVFDWRTETAREAKKRWKDGIPRMKPKADSTPGPGGGEEDGAATAADRPDHLTLREWLTWRQPQYYGNNRFAWSTDKAGNERPIPGGVNYALGWSFIYFLRTTKNEEYQQILPRYFNTLKSFVTAAKALEELEGGGQPAEPGAGGEPVEPGEEGEPAADAPKKGETSDEVERSEWHGESLKEAMRGLDFEQLEKDWLAHSW